VRDYVGYGRSGPGDLSWPGDTRVALNIVFAYEEGAERMKPLGDAENEGMVDIPKGMPDSERDLAVESLYEYGSRVGVWRLARLFDSLEVPVTVFAAAVALERNPEVGEWIRETGHDVCAHGWRWDRAWTLGRDEERRRIVRAVSSIERTTGTRPVGWYTRYGPSVHTRELLVEVGGFRYDSDAYNDDAPYYSTVGGQQLLILPYSQSVNDGKFVRPQGYGSPSDFVDTAKRNLDYLIDDSVGRPSIMNIGIHARLMGQPNRAHALREFIEYAQGRSEVWIAHRVDIADHWLRHCPPV
jgi:peptidoglycan/xylan/chitin deacetylase (PgdA/CDA1 family)